MSTRIVSVSTAPYDGHPVPVALDSLAGCGISWVEPAFIVGYTEPFDEGAFGPVQARQYRAWLAQSGLNCFAMSSHIDLGSLEAVSIFVGRMDFARAIGASVIATNAALRTRETQFFHNIAPLLRHAEALGLVIAIENPGDGRDNLVNTAADGLQLVARIGSPHLRLNYDPANLASHDPQGPDPAADAVRALPACAHLHLKDVKRTPEGWFFTPIGEGDVDCETLLGALVETPDLPVSIELPLRLHRRPDAQPSRNATPVPIATIAAAVTTSCQALERFGIGPSPSTTS